MTELETKLLESMEFAAKQIDDLVEGHNRIHAWPSDFITVSEMIKEDVAEAKQAIAAAEAVQPDGDVQYMQVYRAKLKTRRAMARDIPADMRGWWYDVSPGQTLLLRQAVQSDLDRCTLDAPRSQNPDDYMCETMERGSLVSKAAIEYMHPESCVFAAIRSRGNKHIQSGADSSASQ